MDTFGIGIFEILMVGSGNLVAFAGSSMLLTRRAEAMSGQIPTTLNKTPQGDKHSNNEHTLSFILMACLIVCRFLIDIPLLTYTVAVLFALSPIVSWRQSIKWIDQIDSTMRNYWLQATTLKHIGYAATFAGVALWTIKISLPVH